MLTPYLRFLLLLLLLLSNRDSLRVLGQDEISISLQADLNRFSIDQSSGAASLYLLEESADLQSWSPWAHSWGPFREYVDLDSDRASTRFYRINDLGSGVQPDWVNQLGSDPTPVVSKPRYEGDLRWVKFAMPLDQTGTVYFQNSQNYPFHFDFATRHLPSFSGMSASEFELVSLFPDTQEVVLGAIVFPANPLIREAGIQFVGQKSFPTESVLKWLDIVSSRIRLDGQWRFFYMPTFEQNEAALADENQFQDQGFSIDSPARWVDRDAIYSKGWALGRLQVIPPGDLDSAFSNGTLRSTDILVLESVPAEVPPVAGIISFSPATPNSHVAILAQSFGIPFAFVTDSFRQTQLLEWSGEDVVLIASENEEGVDVKTLRVGNQLTESQKAQLLDLKQLPKLEYAPIQRANQLAFRVSDLTPEHLPFVGGKAANLGFLLRSLPDHSPKEAIAFSFDLWTGFMSQMIPGGLTLRENIAQKLNGLQFPVVDPAELSAKLKEVRELIKGEAGFSALQQRQILQALIHLDSNRKIRFRSSTNVEDSEFFSGAGLYDSFSGCLADDLDQDSDGPSACDPNRKNERGVFRAIQKVFASFYNENAFLERLRRGVNENEVGMAILAHYSFPDEIEWANGVATMRVARRPEGGLHLLDGHLVTQKEAFSVANPDRVAAPEIVSASVSETGEIIHDLVQGSGLVQLGATVLEWPQDYTLLTELLFQASGAYLEFFEDQSEILLDFEYKFVAPGAFVIKQIRVVPQPPLSGQLPPISFSNVDAFEVVQGEFGDMMARHRLKSIWRFQSWGVIGEDLPNHPGNLLNVDLEFLHNHEVVRFQGNLNTLPGAEVRMEGKELLADWYWGEDEERVDYQLVFNFLYQLDRRPSPFLDLSDAEIELSARYATPRPKLDLFRNRVTMIRQESVNLADIDPADTKLDFPHVTWRRRFNANEGDLAISTEFFVGTYKIRGETPWILKTFVLQDWGGTRVLINGLDSIELESTFSQTYWPGHHNFIETLVLEPRLERGLDPAILTELESRNIRAWILTHDSANVSPTLTSKIQVLTLDNRLLDL